MQGLRRMTRQASTGRPGAAALNYSLNAAANPLQWACEQGMLQPPPHRDEKRSWIDGSRRRDGEC